MDQTDPHTSILPDPDDLPPWQVKSSAHLLHDRWLKVRADACVTAEGVEIAPYYVLEYPDWVQVVALDAEDNIYLLQQYRHALGVVSLEVPGGAIDASDANPIEAAARELREETGLSASEWEYVGALAPNPATHSNLSHIVLARNVEIATKPADDPTERTRLVRMPIRQAIGLALEGKMIQSIHVAGLTLALHKAGKWDASALAVKS
ncbi:NUDIX hydrolase [Rhizobium leucaenae]|uniref:8-oxo-dGTP pyrophosphatase MutT (NUDIX family) n=1 Tax=Rhizobium leucaenae TaxID=29450 RepID=A0A7W6ZY55_9HYPH|nr:NUDIX hydrolase [Rhizobium leucaenae]MBB4570313.1 8-oxo-dGTP pyrophosphatase MutT (NUDIX family) [Rhizobium leucaenae]MBB6302858.1 8-oxo-dGTP pyrophosphatase MutT (NUDIX family) [Rhizobium leucaenae]